MDIEIVIFNKSIISSSFSIKNQNLNKMSSCGSDNDVLSSPVGDHGIETEVDLSSIKKIEPPGFQDWAQCKKQAWLQIDVNPNAFFYRHVLPNEERKNGPWSEEEKALFLKNLKEHPPESGHWGLFARNIPGRVGYQCNAYFKKLVAAGEIEGYTPKEDSENKHSQPKEASGSDNDSEIKVHTPKKKKSCLMNFKGEDYAYKYNIIDSSSFHFIPEDYDSEISFHETLLSELKNPETFQRFVNNTNVYYKIGK